MSKTKRLAVLPLGGVGEIGMNMMVYECDGDLIVVDAGVCFGDASTPGVDIILPDTKYLRDNAKRLKAVFITHAHEDHIGSLGYLWDELEVPVHVTPFAAKVLNDKLRQAHQKDDGRIVIVKEGERYKAGKFEVEFVHASHSILEMHSLAIRTSYGLVVHTGDYKFDDNPMLAPKSNIKRFKELGKEGVLAMLGDSTNSFTEGFSGSEGELNVKLEKIIKATENRLFFSTFASNTPRLIATIQSAANCGRKTCLIGRTAQNMIKYAKELNYFPVALTNYIIEADEAAKMPRNEVMVVASGTQGEGRASLTRFSKGGNIRGLKIQKGDTVLMSSFMIPGNERPILDVMNRLTALGANLIHRGVEDVHVSGHGSREDMKKMYGLLKPQIVVPVHGEEMHLVEQEKLARSCGVKKVMQVRNGQKLVLAEEGEKPHIMQNTFHHGVNYLDGYNILDEDMWIVDERRKLSYEGVAFVSVAVQQESREILADPVITTCGLLDPSFQSNLIKEAEQKVAAMLGKICPDNTVVDAVQFREALSQTIRKHFNQERGKKPVVIVQIVEV